jgi:hypothetical protein
VACGPAPAPSPTPEDPFAATRRWGAATTTYRFERTTLIMRPEGGTSVAYEIGVVARPNRQQIVIRGGTTSPDASSEIIIIGQQAWVRQAALGRGWEAARQERPTPDPLTLALGTLAAAGPARDLGERSQPDGRRCRGQGYTFDLARVPDWPAVAGEGAMTAEAAVWLLPDGVLCHQTVRLSRDGRQVAELGVTFLDPDVPVTIEPPLVVRPTAAPSPKPGG